MEFSLFCPQKTFHAFCTKENELSSSTKQIDKAVLCFTFNPNTEVTLSKFLNDRKVCVSSVWGNGNSSDEGMSPICPAINAWLCIYKKQEKKYNSCSL